MTPEQLVPFLETCQKLKEAGYPQGKTYFHYIQRTWEPNDSKWFVYPRESSQAGIAAPTLQELLEELPKTRTYNFNIFSLTVQYVESTQTYYVGYFKQYFFQVHEHRNPAEAAALLWLELYEKGGE